jgi:uncharacterized RDD family membrane protein YckC
VEVASLNLSASAVPSTPYQQSGLVTVGFGKRALARIIDIVIHLGVALTAGVLMAIIVVIAASISGSSPDPLLEKMQKASAASQILSLLGMVMYSLICEGLHGSSAGKYLLGLVVLREDGRPCTYTQAVARSFAFIIDSFFFGLVGYQSMKNSPTDQRYGDKWAGTVVVTRASAPAGSLRGPGRFIGVFFLALFLDALALAASTLV